ncbi:hypothetical protein KR026_003270 [Drosophila bipectinata]|nr:hypothetical protein KR026_003270 [Drosophila bipectinata]
MVEDPSIPPSCWNSLPQPTKESRDNSGVVYVRILDHHSVLYRYAVKTTSKMVSLMTAYGNHSGQAIGSFRFFYQGRLVAKEDTVTGLGLEWGDVIRVTAAQITLDLTPSESSD